MNKQHLTWTHIEDLAIRLADRLPIDYDVMLVITRGGMVPACIISERLNLRNILVAAVKFYTLQDHTLEKTIVLHSKPSRTTFTNTRPDFFVDETDAWIVYPWDVGEATLPTGVLESLSEA